MELKCGPTENTDPQAPASWSAPQAAYAAYRPGLSPYLHYWQGLRAARNQGEPPPRLGPRSGSKLPDQEQEALEELIARSLRA
jgi:hypothetical protein